MLIIKIYIDFRYIYFLNIIGLASKGTDVYFNMIGVYNEFCNFGHKISLFEFKL